MLSAYVRAAIPCNLDGRLAIIRWVRILGYRTCPFPCCDVALAVHAKGGWLAPTALSLQSAECGSVAVTIGRSAVTVGGAIIAAAIVGIASCAGRDGASRETGDSEADSRARTDAATTTAPVGVAAMAVTTVVVAAPTVAVTVTTRTCLGCGRRRHGAEGKGDGRDQC